MYTEGNIIADLKTASEKERLVKVTHSFLMAMQAGLSIHYTVILHCYSWALCYSLKGQRVFYFITHSC